MQYPLTDIYAQRLAALVRCETISSKNPDDKRKFYEFHDTAVPVEK